LKISQDERRQYFRIEDSLTLSYQKVPLEAVPDCVERLEQELDSHFTVVSSLAAVTQEMTGTLHKIEASRPEIAAYLKSLDKKIDILGRAFLAQATELFTQPTQEVNLSATGISFHVSEPIPKGTILELKILLLPSYTGILCFAEVVSCDELDASDSDHCYNLRTNFSHIRTRDRDVLIQHVIQRQGAQIRQAREAQERES
jgi:hypothetical protein